MSAREHWPAAGRTAVPRPAILQAFSPGCTMPADLLVEVPTGYGVSLYRWLSSAAVVANVEAAGVTIRADANRVFRLADVLALVGEWMQAHAIEAVFGTCDGALFSIVPLPLQGRREKPKAPEEGRADDSERSDSRTRCRRGL